MSPTGPHICRLRPRVPVRESRARSLFVLACFSPTRRVLTAEQIAAQLHLSSRTAEGLAENLVRVGCLDLDRSGAYRLAGPSRDLGVRDEL
jgi:DNA-binding IclR family transcriptional regulator